MQHLLRMRKEATESLSVLFQTPVVSSTLFCLTCYLHPLLMENKKKIEKFYGRKRVLFYTRSDPEHYIAGLRSLKGIAKRILYFSTPVWQRGK